MALVCAHLVCIEKSIFSLYYGTVARFPGVRRVIIVEAGSKRVEGIISLSDVFRFLLG